MKKLHNSQIISKLVVITAKNYCSAYAQLYSKFRKNSWDLQGFRWKSWKSWKSCE